MTIDQWHEIANDDLDQAELYIPHLDEAEKDTAINEVEQQRVVIYKESSHE